MNLFAEAPAGFLMVLVGLLICAAVQDAWRMRISNLLILAILAVTIAAFIAAGITTDIWQNLVSAAVVLLAGTALFSAGKMGGGDVKLLAAVVLWVDFKTALWVVSAIFIAGGIVAVLLIARRMFLRGRQVAYRDMRIAYGVPIAVGTLAVIGSLRFGSL